MKFFLDFCVKDQSGRDVFVGVSKLGKVFFDVGDFAYVAETDEDNNNVSALKEGLYKCRGGLESLRIEENVFLFTSTYNYAVRYETFFFTDEQFEALRGLLTNAIALLKEQR